MVFSNIDGIGDFDKSRHAGVVENGSPTGVGLGSKGKVRSRDSDHHG